MNCRYETEWCRNHVHCYTCEHYEIGNLTTAIDMLDNKVKKLFGYKIFCGIFAGVLVDTSWENAKARVIEYYKGNKRYLKYCEMQKELCRDNEELFGDYKEPMIEIYDLSERFENDISGVYELTI